MKTKTSELEGAALDWAVAKAQEWDDETLLALARQYKKSWPFDNHTPSTDWSQCGPLIERYNIQLECGPLDKVGAQVLWEATVVDFETMTCDSAEGDTPLVAVCRAVVFGLIGDTVDVPEGLL